MTKPFISICIPAYKRPQNLQRLLQSILSQNYTNYEIIITDDSPDESISEIVKAFSGRLTIQYFKNAEPAGIPANWNIAINKATGEWIKLMHDDDWFALPGALELFATAAVDTKAGFIFSACNNINTATGNQVAEYLTWWKKEMLEDGSINLFYANVIGHPSTVMHRRDNNIDYDIQFRWVVDIDFYIRFLEKHNTYIYIPQILVNIGTDETQVSYLLYKNPAVEVPEYLTMLAKYPSNLLMQSEYVFHCVWNLVKKFRISNIKMINDLGFKGQLPDHLKLIIDFQKRIPRLVIKQSNWSKLLMKRCFYQIKKQASRTETSTIAQGVPKVALYWTESKVALIELIYALHSHGTFNNGVADIKDIAASLQQLFGVELDDYYSTFLELKMRKTGRTDFLHSLIQSLNKEMDEAENILCVGNYKQTDELSTVAKII